MKKIIVGLLSGLLLTSLLATQAGSAPPPKTVVDLAVGASGEPNVFDDDGGDFDILVAAVLALELDGVLAGDGQRTVFAPTDQAFIDLVEDLTGDVVSEADAFAAVAGVPGVADIVAYHVSPERFPGARVVNATEIPTLNSTGATITKDRKSLVLDPDGSAATVIAPDLRARNGVVHVIDTVLMP